MGKLWSVVAITLAVSGLVRCGSTIESQEKSRVGRSAQDVSNALINEKSPYLLQHASNPVDWYPWGNEAFDKARNENKPIFLSIGYSTCHWCHVMARESFEDAGVARLMNESFVSVKVDREERPDLDNVYMMACQMMTGSGGWPLTVIMTPDGKPFFAGTYLPRESRFGQTGLMELLQRVVEVWSSRPEEVLTSADEIALAIEKISTRAPAGELDESTLHDAHKQLSDRFDDKHGGFGAAPKFPTPHNLLFLLRYWKRTGENRALEMVERTLRAMRAGGIYDHIGFGFHRYSTDAEWLVPHFEKMLYDQALTAMAYIEAYQAVGKEEYATTAREILEYVLRDMTSPNGGFYSAEDADSEGEEGKFYVWTEEEIQGVLGKEDAELVMTALNVVKGGNYREQTSGKPTGANILHMKESIEEIGGRLGVPESVLEQRLESARRVLFSAREKRTHPHKDDKILADWNGLMIAALAKVGRVLGEERYVKAATDGAEFVLYKMRDPDGRLYHRFRDDEAAVAGHLDDYAFLIWGLLELYESGFEVGYLKQALDLKEQMIEHFWDEEGGGFYFTADDSEKLLVRKKEIYDGATPAGNSVAMLCLLRLGRMTGNSRLEERAAEVGRAFSGDVNQAPSAHTQLLVGLDFAIGPSYEVVIAGRTNASDTEAMLRVLNRQFVPNKVVLLKPSEVQSPPIIRVAPFTEYQTSIDGKATAYVCRNYACDTPTTDPEQMVKLLTMGR